MKYLILLFTALFSSVALAHEDHALEGIAHEVYHVMFLVLLVLVLFKAVSWFKTRSKNSSNKFKK
ncbi:hypothetical protein [Catenovulum maritimum]|uniref:Uncharacterized protein n=1 Tax=Catenovulum maritimum TaxID=1513271 RepID=A0A0J8GNJ6_9ALTE|nr:hypothetical protein [Catenovulum maritimum]KMT64362.1 hypothetical protein XM47_14785 [Catenovulum maritimum]